MQRNQQGFTLIELVIVIVILGILSAFALPRFADLGGDARVASVEGAAGAVRSSAAITRSAWLASGQPENEVELEEGQTIAVSDNGYPAATATGIVAAAQLSDNDYFISGDNSDPFQVGIPNSDDDGLLGGDCGFSYDEDDGSVDFLDLNGC